MVAKCPLPKAILAELYERRLQWIYLESCYSTLRLPSSRRAAHRHIGEFISEVQAKPSTERLTLYKEKLRTLERYASWRSLRPLRRLGAISRQSWRADRSPQSPAAHIQNLFSEHRMLEIVALYQANPACRVWNDSDIALLGVQAAEMAGCPGLLLPLAAKQLARDGVDPRICFAVLRPLAAQQPHLVSDLLQELHTSRLVRLTTPLKLLKVACRSRAGQSLHELKRPRLEDTTDWELLRFGASDEAGKGEILSRVLSCPISIDTAFEGPPVTRIRAARPGSGRTRPEPLVSVILTAHNAAGTITASLDSIAAQTWRNLELVVVADGSTDATDALVEQFAAHAPFPVISLSNESRVGPFRSRNLALGRATGEYVTFHDPDGWMHPRRLELQVEALEHGESASASLSRHACIDDDGHFVLGSDGRVPQHNWSSLLIRRTAAQSAGYFDAYREGADSEFVERIERFWGGVLHAPALLGITAHREHGSGTFASSAASSQLCEYAAEWHRVHHRHSLAAAPFRIELEPRRSVFAAAARKRAGRAGHSPSRQYLRTRIDEAIVALDYERALKLADRGCTKFPATRAFWKAKMLAERRLGRWSAALATTDIFKDLIEDELGPRRRLIPDLSGQRLRALYSLGRTAQVAQLGTSLVRKYPGRFEELLFRMATRATLNGSDAWSEPELVRLSAAIPKPRAVSAQGRIRLLAEALLAHGSIERAETLLQGLPLAQNDTLLLGANVAGKQARSNLRADRLRAYFTARGQANPFETATQGHDELLSDPASVVPAEPPGPKVSVVMTARNGAPHLARAVESIQHQTWTNFELIVVDDCSESDFWAALKDLTERDSRIRLLQNPKNLGPYVSRNQAIQVATGEFVACLDSDAWPHPRWLQLQAARLVESEGIVATLSESLQMTKDGHFRIRSNGEYSQLNTSTVMYRRSAIDRVGYYDSVSLGADLEFLARLRLVYGESAVAIIKQLTMLCCPRESTQATEAEQGRSAAGKSGLHLAYKACFGRWHRAVKEHAYVPFPHVPRRFPAPRQIIVEVAP